MISKITTAPSDNEVVGKINEIIDGKQDTLVSGTNIKTVGGTSLLGSGNVAIPTVDQTYSATSANAQSGVAVANAIAPKQDTLVSGTNIKTINGTSLLGSGNIVIETSSTPNVDGETISYNSSDALQAIAVKNVRDGSTLPIWHGTEYQWNHGDPTTWYYWQTSVTELWTSGGNLPDSTMRIMAFGNGVFVAIKFGISSIETIRSTDNGVTWQAGGNLPSSQYWSGIVFGNGVFIATTGFLTKKSAYSTDGGATWQAGGDLPSDSTWGALAYGDGRFIACSSSNSSAYSTDNGVTWIAGGNLPIHLTIVSASSAYKCLAFGNGVFVGIGNGTSCYTTDGGVTWQTGGSFSEAGSLLTYGNGKFFIVGSSTSYFSTDNGVTWQTGGSIPRSTANQYSISYGDGIIMVVGDTSEPKWTYGAVYSTDYGMTWTTSVIPNINGYDVAYGNNRFIAITDAKSSIFSVTYDKCYTDTANPTTASVVYSEPNVTSSYTISSVSSGAITLSNNNTYYYNQSGNVQTYDTIGNSHPEWLCNINNVGVKIGNTIVATAGGSGSSYTAGDGIDITSNEISVTSDISTGATLGATAVQPSILATVATSGSYNDLSNKPTIPTVNNATLTIQKNGSNVATFTANASSNVTANISVPTNTNELTNGAGFITSGALSGYQTTANLVTSVSSSSTNSQYPSAKLFYDTVGDIETTINTIRGV